MRTRRSIVATSGRTLPVLFLAGSALSGVAATPLAPAAPPSATPADTVAPRGNGLIAFVSDRDGNPEIYSMYWDGDHQTRLTSNPGNDRSPAWSPDGKRIAFVSDRTGDDEVWVMNGDGTGAINLTNKPSGDDDHPTWSPSGTQIAFVSDRTGNDEVFVMNADGTTQRNVSKSPGSADSDPAWSPLGTRIAFTSTQPGNTDVFTMKPSGTQKRNLTVNPAGDAQPAWSRDGQRIVFTSTRTGNPEIYVMNTDGTGVKNLSKRADAADSEPRFSPDDGTKVVFTTDRDGNDEVFYMRATDGANQFTLSHHGAGDTFADWQGLPASPAWDSPIEHVVIVYMENQSFDGVLGKLCVEDARCDGVLQGELHDGTIIDLPEATDIVPDSPHGFDAQQTAINGGLMNGFSLLDHCEGPGYTCYQQYRPDQIPTISALARAFALSDRTFELDTVGSFGSHLNLVATTLGGFYRATHRSPEGGEHGPGSGCDSGAKGDWQPNIFDEWQDQYTCIPQPDGWAPTGPTAVSWIPTIMDRLDEAGLPWRIYGTPEPGVGTGYGWAICPIFADCLYTSQKDNLVDRSNFLTDAAAGTLPAFSILTPDPPNSQHNSRSMLQGDNWIAEQVGAVINGPQWESTALLLTWDDCGCFYDHVSPPPDLGIREPFLIVSPWAKRGYTDSNPASFASMLAFAEKVFGLAPLTTIDADAYDYADSFDFTQEPLAPIPLPTHPVPLESIQWLLHYPVLDEDDPT
jgi:Tol biopolymer transport system component/phospholipase C